MKKPFMVVTTVLFDDGTSEVIEATYEGTPIEVSINMPIEPFDTEPPREYIAYTSLREVYGRD